MSIDLEYCPHCNCQHDARYQNCKAPPPAPPTDAMRRAFEASYGAKYFQSDFARFNGTCYLDATGAYYEAINVDFIAFQKGYQAATAHILALMDKPEARERVAGVIYAHEANSRRGYSTEGIRPDNFNLIMKGSPTVKKFWLNMAKAAIDAMKKELVG